MGLTIAKEFHDRLSEFCEAYSELGLLWIILLFFECLIAQHIYLNLVSERKTLIDDRERTKLVLFTHSNFIFKKKILFISL